MKVFALYVPELSGLVRVWVRSWKKRGWSPRLVTHRDLKKYGSFLKAVKAKGGKATTELTVINFSLRPPHKTPNSLSANKKSLVYFESEEAVLNCGRSL